MISILNWTNIGADTIDGLQPRYFTPAILCLALAFSNSIIMIDVKVGKGALMKSLSDAKSLAKLMVRIGKAYRKPTICLITNMKNSLCTPP